MNTKIELIPISEIKREDNTFLVDLEKIEYLAFLATTLPPLESFTKIDGYTSALWEYMQEKKYQEKELFLSYDKLIHANQGFSLLSTLIELLLIEKEMRNQKLTNDILDQYQDLQLEYLNILADLKKE